MPSAVAVSSMSSIASHRLSHTVPLQGSLGSLYLQVWFIYKKRAYRDRLQPQFQRQKQNHRTISYIFLGQRENDSFGNPWVPGAPPELGDDKETNKSNKTKRTTEVVFVFRFLVVCIFVFLFPWLCILGYVTARWRSEPNYQYIFRIITHVRTRIYNPCNIHQLVSYVPIMFSLRFKGVTSPVV